jgi:hypothetical protein
MKTKRIKLYVSYLKYERMGNEVPGVKTYTGKTLKGILIKIMEEHLYDSDESFSVKELLENINEVNGDGCDCIISIISSKGKLIYKF